jgi:magnesium chelatase family protein
MEPCMLATSLTAAVVGVDAHLVRVEADTASGFPKFTMVGLPDSSVKESEGRIRAALRNCGYAFKWDRRITVNMAPASLRKMGSSYDLATAVGLLAADGALPSDPLSGVLLVGELALDGSLRPVPECCR